MAVILNTPTNLGTTGQNPAGQNVTVGTGCKVFVVAIGCWEPNISSITLAGAAPTGGMYAVTGFEGGGIYWWVDPPTGTQVLDWAWASAPTDGPSIWYVSATSDAGGVEARNHSAVANEGAATTTINTNVASGDRAFAVGWELDAVASITTGGWAAEAANVANNNYNGRPYSITLSGTSITAASQVAVAMIVLREFSLGPVIETLAPADNAVGVDIATTLTLTFDQAVAAGTGNIVITETGVGVFETVNVTDVGQVVFSGSNVTITLSGPLDYETAYDVQIDAGAIESDPGADPWAGIADATTWNFTTAAPVGPQTPTVAPIVSAVLSRS